MLDHKSTMVVGGGFKKGMVCEVRLPLGLRRVMTSSTGSHSLIPYCIHLHLLVLHIILHAHTIKSR